MTSDRPLPIPTPPSGRTRTVLGRVAAITASATLSLGAIAVPAATASGSDTEAAGSAATAADTAGPIATLGAATVKPGGDMAFSVSGFPAGAKLSIKLDDATLLGQFTLGDDGSLSGTVTLPADAPVGSGHWLRFLAPQTSVKSADLTITAATPTPTPTATPRPTPTETAAPATPRLRITSGTRVAAGGSVSFSLTGFAKGQRVTAKLDDQTILGQWENAVHADGTFSGKVTVPKGTSAGAHWLRILAPEPPTSLRADVTVTSTGSGGGSAGGPTGGSTGGSTGGGPGDGSTGGSSGSGSTGGGSTGGSSGGTPTGGSVGNPAATATITAGSRVAAGRQISFRVTGFPAGRRLTVKLDDAKILGQWEGGIGADGSFSGSVTVPDDVTEGPHWLRFLAPSPPTSLRADFTVTEDPATGGGSVRADATGGATAGGGATPVPAASGAPAAASDSRGAKAAITASRVQPGGTIHFKVTNFPAGQTVTIKLDDEDILGQWKADAAGNHEDDVVIPALTPAGAHWLRFLAPNPPTTLKVDITVTATDGTGTDAAQAGGATTAPGAGTDIGAGAVPASASVSYATIGWSAAAAAVGGAAGAGVTSMRVVRRRRPEGPAGA
ncbi:hypothetical protein [Streptomyces bauhiniae]